MGMSILLKKRKGLIGAILIVTIFIGFVALYPKFVSTSDRFLMKGDFDRLLMAKQSAGMVTGSFQFTYAVNLIAQLIGPLPTLTPDTKLVLSFFHLV